jgi:hypothetical protein
MQLFVILLFMLILPIVSIAQDLLSGTAQPMASIGTWFVYWGVGWRLVAAGVFQLFRPSFTARNIFEIEDPNAHKLVYEIGFGNLAIGITAIASLYFPEWIPAAALAGAIFYLLAGVQHVRNHPTTAPEIAAMVSDLGIAAILIVYLCSLSF